MSEKNDQVSLETVESFAEKLELSEETAQLSEVTVEPSEDTLESPEETLEISLEFAEPTDEAAEAISPSKRALNSYICSRRRSLPLRLVCAPTDTMTDDELSVSTSRSRAFFQRKSMGSASSPLPLAPLPSEKIIVFKKNWGYSPYVGNDDKNRVPDSSYMDFSTCGTARRSSLPISSLQKLFYREGNPAAEFSFDGKPAPEGYIFPDSCDEDVDITDTSDKSDDSITYDRDVPMDCEKAPSVEGTGEEAERVPGDEGDDACRVRPRSGSDDMSSMIQEAFRRRTISVISCNTGATNVESRAFTDSSPFSRSPSLFAMVHPVFPSELSTPSTPIADSFSSFFSAPTFSYPCTPCQSAKYDRPRSQRIEGRSPRCSEKRSPRCSEKRSSRCGDVSQSQKVAARIKAFGSRLNIHPGVVQDRHGAPTGYFSIVDGDGTRRSVREIVRTWGMHFMGSSSP